MSKKMSLEEALGRADIDPEGRFHDGLNDAVNTGLLIEKLELNPDDSFNIDGVTFNLLEDRRYENNEIFIHLEKCQ